MIPYYDDGQAALYQDHGLDVLAALPGESVHCVVTSPPYYGQRDYGLPLATGVPRTSSCIRSAWKTRCTKS